MNYILWISISVIAICLFLYIFGTIKNFSLLQSIPLSLIIPAAGTIVLFFLNDYLPDANHIVKVTTYSLIAIFISTAFAIFEKNKFCLFLSYLAFVASTFSWINLYGTTFNIYYVYTRIKIIVTIAYALGFILISIHTHKQKLGLFFTSTLLYAPAAFLNFCAIVTLSHSRRSYSYILTVGSSLLLLLIAFKTIKRRELIKISDKVDKIISSILLIASEILITTSGYFMIR